MENSEQETIDLADVARRYSSGHREFSGLLINQRGAHLGVHLGGARFERCTFVAVDVNIQDAVAAKFIDCAFRDCKLTSSLLTNTAFVSSTFVGCAVNSVYFRETSISNCRFERCDFSSTRFEEGTVDEITFDDCACESLWMFVTKAKHVRFNACGMTSSQFSKLLAGDLRLENCKSLASASFDRCGFMRDLFKGQNMSGAYFGQCVLTDADLSGANLTGARFLECDLTRANLLGVRVDSQTKFDRCVVQRAMIERHTLELLDDYGQLTRGQRMTLDVTDGALLLRRSYTGFWQWLHLLALLLFLGPYFVLVLREGLTAQTTCPEGASCTTILSRLVDAILSGGRMDGSVSVMALCLFSFMLLYNVGRATLLYKAKSLELQEEASGVPVVFHWGGFWRLLYAASHWGFFANLTIAVFHAALFLDRSVVIKP